MLPVSTEQPTHAPAVFVFTSLATLFPRDSTDSAGDVQAIDSMLLSLGFRRLAKTGQEQNWVVRLDRGRCGHYVAEVTKLDASGFVDTWPGREPKQQFPVLWFAHVFNPPHRDHVEWDADAHVQILTEVLGDIFAVGRLERGERALPRALR